MSGPCIEGSVEGTDHLSLKGGESAQHIYDQRGDTSIWHPTCITYHWQLQVHKALGVVAIPIVFRLQCSCHGARYSLYLYMHIICQLLLDMCKGLRRQCEYLQKFIKQILSAPSGLFAAAG